MKKQINTIKEVVFNYQVMHADGTLSSAQKITHEGVISVQQPRMTYKHGFFNIEATIQNGWETVDYSVVIDGRRITCDGITNDRHYAEFIIEHDNSLTCYDYDYADATFQIDYLEDALEDYLQNC